MLGKTLGVLENKFLRVFLFLINKLFTITVIKIIVMTTVPENFLISATCYASFCIKHTTKIVADPLSAFNTRRHYSVEDFNIYPVVRTGKL